MGLDMYIFSAPAKYRDLVKPSENFDKLYDVSDKVAQWRKANAVHAWFVKNVQNGVDDCAVHRPLTLNDLTTLKNLCEKALESKNPELLPPTSGFFFGNTAVDEWYWRDLEDMSEKISNILNRFSTSEVYYYWSNW